MVQLLLSLCHYILNDDGDKERRGVGEILETCLRWLLNLDSVLNGIA